MILIVYYLLIIVLFVHIEYVYLYRFSYNIKILNTKQLKNRIFMTNERDDQLNRLKTMKSMPGYYKGIPENSNSIAKKETMKIVLTLALLWLVWIDKYQQLQEVLPQVFKPKNKYIKVSSDIVYKDIIEGYRVPVNNEVISLSYKLSFNGLRIFPKDFNSSDKEYYEFTYNNKLSDQLQTSSQLSGISKCLANMKIGSTRSIKLLASELFENFQLPNYITPDSIITCDLTMESLNSNS